MTPIGIAILTEAGAFATGCALQNYRQIDGEQAGTALTGHHRDHDRRSEGGQDDPGTQNTLQRTQAVARNYGQLPLSGVIKKNADSLSNCLDSHASLTP